MNRLQLIKKIKQIADGITRLKNKYVSEQNLSIDYITIFAHSNSEFKKLMKTGQELGIQVDEHNGPVFKLNKSIHLENGILKVFRIREPDQERPQVGCGDFKVFDYKAFKKKYLNGKYEIFELYQGDGFEYIGIKDSDFDYLVYFPSETETEYLGL